MFKFDVETGFPVSDFHTHSFLWLTLPVLVGVLSRMLPTGSRTMYAEVVKPPRADGEQRSHPDRTWERSQKTSYAASSSWSSSMG